MSPEPQALYDLAPVIELMLVGLLLALGPFAWVLWRNRQASPQRRLQALTVLTLFLTFDLVLFGAFTRLTDSGLGCPDWPGCYGSATPAGARTEIAAAEAAMPTGPVTVQKAWIEMVHRYLATGVGVLIIALVAMTWRLRAQARRGQVPALPLSPGWAAFTLFWVCLQGAFGALTVTMKLFPAIVTLHLLGGLVLLALLAYQAVRWQMAAGQGGGSVTALMPVLAGRWRMALVALTILLVFQILLGGWVSTNYAVLACTTFPQCQGSWWPPMDFAQGFSLWRPLGMTPEGQPIAFAALTAIHYVHRLVAYVVLLALVWTGWRMVQQPSLRAPGRAVLALSALQLATGLSNVVLGWPLLAAVLHTGGAAALLAVLVWALALLQPLRVAVAQAPVRNSAPVGATRVSA